MKIIINRYWLWPKDPLVRFGILFTKKGYDANPTRRNHEKIHEAQINELGSIFFMALYLTEFFFWSIATKSFTQGKKQISLEREASLNEYDRNYLKTRKPHSWTKFIIE